MEMNQTKHAGGALNNRLSEDSVFLKKGNINCVTSRMKAMLQVTGMLMLPTIHYMA